MSSLKIYVIDTETTGLCGHPRDLVVDIGICAVDLGEGTVKEAYSSVVGYDTSVWDYPTQHAWIFENTDLTLNDVDEAPPFMDVVQEVQEVLKHENITSFNIGFDMDKFLYREPWSLQNICTEMPCIMLASMDVCKIPGYYGQYKWPKLAEAYEAITVDDPADIKGHQTHRALSDAVMASHILLGLWDKGQYKFTEGCPEE